MSATCHGQSVEITNLLDYERLAQHPASIEGAWNGTTGWVRFPSLTIANEARHEL